MKTIEKAVQSEINIKKSQFICSLFPTKSKKESKEIIQKLNHQYHDATHNCTAYITNDGEGYDDNGEPGGTAGKPMINALRKNDLHNVTAVVQDILEESNLEREVWFVHTANQFLKLLKLVK